MDSTNLRPKTEGAASKNDGLAAFVTRLEDLIKGIDATLSRCHDEANTLVGVLTLPEPEPPTEPVSPDQCGFPASDALARLKLQVDCAEALLYKLSRVQ